LERANYRFSSDRIGSVDPDVLKGLADDKLLASCATALGIAMTDAERAVISRCPVSIQVAMVAVAHSAVSRSKSSPVPITFAWLSGYDFDLKVFEARPGPDSWGGITLILTTPYPL
jgi:hypothetical protein